MASNYTYNSEMTATIANPASLRQTRLGIVMVVAGLSVAAFTGALMKLLSDDLHAIQITWFRFLGFALILILPVAVRFGRSVLRPARPAMQVIRGVSLAAATVSFVVGARTIDYADAIAILYAYPFLLSILAVLFLGEKVRLAGWIGVAGGFVGVLLVMRPEFNAINTGSLFVFLCAVIVSFQMFLNRWMGSFSHPLVTSLWGAIVATVLLSLLVPFYWTPLTGNHFWLLCLVAITGSINQVLVVVAFSKAEASTLAPFTYFEIAAAVMLGFLLFGTMPSWLSWVGIGFIAASGLLVARSLSAPVAPRRNPKF